MLKPRGAMAAQKKVAMAARKKQATRPKTAARKSLKPAEQQRGLEGSEVLLSIGSPEVSNLVGNVEELKTRGFRSPYVRNYVVARINPVRFHRSKKGETEPPMAIAAALTRMSASAKKFNTATVKESDLALVAAVSGGES